MKTYYLRNTHDDCGTVLKSTKAREKHLDEQQDWGESKFVLHMLSHDKPQTFEQIQEQCFKYSLQEKEINLSEKEIALGICMLLSVGLAKAISI